METRRTRWFSLTALLALVLAGAWQHPARGQAAVTVYEGARVITGDGRAPIANATFVVASGRFTQVGRAGQVTVPAGATRVNLAGKTVMPTLIDTHTHLSQDRAALTQDLLRRSYWGVSATMSLGQDVGEAPFQVRDQPIAGAARLFTAGRGITMPEPGRTTVPYWVNNAAEARRAVQEQAAKKVDFIKIWVDTRGGTVKKMTPEVYQAIIDEAHKQKLRVTGHIFELEDAKGVLRAGIDAFAHVPVRDKEVDDEFLRMVRERPNLVLNPNLPDRGVATDLSWLRDAVSAGELQKLQAAATDRRQAQAFFNLQARNLKKMADAGVKIVLGTDGNTPWQPHVEMADMVAAGLTPMQVIVAATRNGAELLRMTDAGTIAPNKSADFLVLDANPLDDITNTRKIAAVYLRGAEIDRARMRVNQTN